MKIKFLGACREVGRSGILLDTGSEKILLDYGVKLHPLECPSHPLGPGLDLDGILVSHAHLDHSGYVPKIYGHGQVIFGDYYDVPLYLTDLSLELAEMLWLDSIKMAKNEGHEPPFSKYSIESAKTSILAKKRKRKKMRNKRYRRIIDEFKIRSTKVKAYDAGHIPGSTSFFLDTGKKKIVYTGDINTSTTRLVTGRNPRFPKTDVLIIESTYWKRERPPRKKEEKKLLGRVRDTVENGGIALVPTLAVGRSQEVLLILDELEKDLDAQIYLDGMVVQATDKMLGHPEFLRDRKKLSRMFSKAAKVDNKDEREKIVQNPAVIITTSGMLEGGPVIHYLDMLGKREDCSITMTNYLIKGTAGRILMDTGMHLTRSERRKYLKTGELPEKDKIKCDIDLVNLSSHCGGKELIKYVKKVDPENVFVVHGKRANEFALELRGMGYDAVAPKLGEVFKL